MKHFVKSLPVLSILLALACDTLLPDSAQHPAAEHPYFTWALLIGLAVYVIALLISLSNTKVRDKLSYSALFYAGAVLVLNILNLLTAKFSMRTARSSRPALHPPHACCSSAGSAVRLSAC